MKTVIFVRHAKATPRHLPIPDKDRPLQERGRKDLALLGPVLLEKGVQPQRIYSSTANRAAQTAVVLAGVFGLHHEIFFHDALYNPWPVGMLNFIGDLEEDLDSVMVVGHNPDIEEAAGLLGPCGFAPDMPTSACTCLSFPVENWLLIREGSGQLVYHEYPGKYRGRD